MDQLELECGDDPEAAAAAAECPEQVRLVDLAGAGAPLEALAETFGDGAWLLILDNLE